MKRRWLTWGLLTLWLVGCAPAAERAPSPPAGKGAGDVAVMGLAAPTTAAVGRAATGEEVLAEVEAREAFAPGRMAPPESDRQQISIKAGEVDDNEQWDDYLLYRRQYGRTDVHPVDVSERYLIVVRDAAGKTVHNAAVRITLGNGEPIFEAVADAGGRVVFAPRAFGIAEGAESFTVHAWDLGDPALATDVTFAREPALLWEVTIPGAQTVAATQLDLLFLIDTTGSMQDEIDSLKSTILEISAQIDSLPERPDVRFGMVIYRDREDSYVTRSYDFTPDVTEFHQKLKSVTANGGGDYPESVNEALHVALQDVAWRQDKTVRMIFLIADAPPHLDYPQDYDYAEEMVAAASRGIKLFPIASSGLDDQGEYIYRQIAQFTGGKFLFLTYSAEGSAPGDKTTHHVDDYTVENLDALVVRLVQEELAKLSR